MNAEMFIFSEPCLSFPCCDRIKNINRKLYNWGIDHLIGTGCNHNWGFVQIIFITQLRDKSKWVNSANTNLKDQLRCKTLLSIGCLKAQVKVITLTRN